MSYPDLPPLYLEDPEGHRWVRPASPPCPHCECCSAALCQLATNSARRCSQYVEQAPDVANVDACRCTVYARDEDARVLHPEPPVLGECFSLRCERLISVGSQHCCAPCLAASDSEREVDRHSAGCEARKAFRHGHPVVIGMTYLLVRADPAHLTELLRGLPDDLAGDADVRSAASDGTAVVASRNGILPPKTVDLVRTLLAGSDQVELLGSITGEELDERQPRR